MTIKEHIHHDPQSTEVVGSEQRTACGHALKTVYGPCTRPRPRKTPNCVPVHLAAQPDCRAFGDYLHYLKLAPPPRMEGMRDADNISAVAYMPVCRVGR